jgi:ABC-type xylose transport system permease subunit
LSADSGPSIWKSGLVAALIAVAMVGVLFDFPNVLMIVGAPVLVVIGAVTGRFLTFERGERPVLYAAGMIVFTGLFVMSAYDAYLWYAQGQA